MLFSPRTLGSTVASHRGTLPPGDRGCVSIHQDQMDRRAPRSQLSHPGEAGDPRSPANPAGAKTSHSRESSPNYAP